MSLAGGRGGLLGPIAAAFILGLIRLDLVFLGVNPNYSTVIQGSIMIPVVMVVGFITSGGAPMTAGATGRRASGAAVVAGGRRSASSG